MWILLWALITIGILGFAAWSYQVLFQQKSLWTAFAKSQGIEILRSRFLDPISLSGEYRGRRMTLYIVSDEASDARNKILHTHCEMFLTKMPPVPLIISKRALPSFMTTLLYDQVLQIQGVESFNPTILSTPDPLRAGQWLTAERQTLLAKCLAMGPKDSEVMLICDANQAFLLWRSQDPLILDKTLNYVLKNLSTCAEALDKIAASEKPASLKPAESDSQPLPAPQSAPAVSDPR